jgi:predicted short-subunit dehydrogenase-like oxidoreductase (DUF2520 family)
VSARTTHGRISSPFSGVRFAVVGAGRLGASLALAMRAGGGRFVGYTCLTPAGRARAESYLGMPAAGALAELVAADPDYYVLSVPDAAIAAVAWELAGCLGATRIPPETPASTATQTAGSGPLVLHTSGVSSVGLLQPCADMGAVTLAFHPLQTFSEPISGSTRFAGAATAITPPPGPQAATATEAGFALAERLGSRPFLLPDDKRAIYHAAACVASNYLVTLESVAQRLFVAAGMPEDDAVSFFLPLVQAALDNVASQGPVDALTGPLSRGDIGTIADHLQALAHSSPDIAAVYRCMGLATLELVRARGELDPSILPDLADLLRPTDDPPQC